MKKIAIVTLAVALENEKGYSRFRFLANLLSDYYDVHLITSTFQHWEKKQRDEKRIESVSRRYQVKLAYEPGYKKNVDLRRLSVIRQGLRTLLRSLKKISMTWYIALFLIMVWRRRLESMQKKREYHI